MNTTRRSLIPRSLFLLVILATWLVFGHAGHTFAGDRDGLGTKISGTYLGVQENGAQLLQINADGNLSFIFSEQFAGGTLSDPFSNTLGSWVKTGRREITSIALDLTLQSISGTFVGVAAVTYVITFDKHFRKARVTCEGAIFPPGVDPFDSEAVPLSGSAFNCGNDPLDFYRVPSSGNTHKSTDD